MDSILALVPAQYAVYASAVVGVAAAIAMALPRPTATSGKAYVTVYNVINFIGANKFNATNAGAKPSA